MVSTKKWFLVLACITLLVVILLVVGAAGWGLKPVNVWTGIIQSFITALAIIIGGSFAAYKLQLFRDFEPHVSVSQTATHRAIGTQYIHVFVTATLHNGSRVKVAPRRGFFEAYRVVPASDQEVERIWSEVFSTEERRDMGWPRLDHKSLSWEADEFVIEPGEHHDETCEFIVTADVRSVIIYAYFYNPPPTYTARSAEGWGATLIHDIDVQ